MKPQTKHNVRIASGWVLLVASVIGFCATFNPFFAVLHLAGWVVLNPDEEKQTTKL